MAAHSTMPVLSREQARAVDRRAIDEYGVSGLVLMENAGRGAAELLLTLGARGPVVVCCGRGNNAGDGFVIARHLDLHNIPVKICLRGDPAELTPDAAANFQIVKRSGIPIELFGNQHDDQRFASQIHGAEWLVDALLGTGAQGEPRPPLSQMIEQMNASGLPILAVDLPSGLDCETGQPANQTIRAQHTCTFVAAKRGFLAPAAAPFLGKVHVLHIGAPRVLVEEILRPA
jgi:NAD(P)H-hydrate epimerase